MKVRGLISPRRLSEAATAALASGNIDELLRINRAEFGGWTMMADADDDDDDDADDDGDSGADDDGDDDGDKSKKSGKTDDSDGDDSDDTEKLRKRMKAADRRAEEAERRLKKIEDEKKDDLTRAKDELSEVQSKVDELTETVNTLRLQNAFLTANDHTWHDPDIALSLAGSKGYLEDVVDDDGEVDKKNLKKALERLAKEHAYLVKTEVKDDAPGVPSGEPGGGRSDNQKDDKAKKSRLQQRFPVLNR